MSPDEPATVTDLPPESPVDMARDVLEKDRARRVTGAKAELDALLERHGVVLFARVATNGPNADGSMTCYPMIVMDVAT